MRLYSREYIIVGKEMSSIVIEEAQIISNEKRVATADLAQHKNQLRGVLKEYVRKYFLVCESCFWCASYYEKRYNGYENLSRAQDMTTPNASCPACGIDAAIKYLPISSDKSDNRSIGDRFH
jgi:rubrerythrin